MAVKKVVRSRKGAHQKHKKYDLWVGVDDNDDGHPLPWTAAFIRRDCRLYIRDWLGDDTLGDNVRIKRATLTLAPPKKRRRK